MTREQEPDCVEGLDHAWTGEGEGGCDENPVWSLGGTAFKFRRHCRFCGVVRTEIEHGSQRNPGDEDTTTYEVGTADEEAIAVERRRLLRNRMARARRRRGRAGASIRAAPSWPRW